MGQGGAAKSSAHFCVGLHGFDDLLRFDADARDTLERVDDVLCVIREFRR